MMGYLHSIYLLSVYILVSVSLHMISSMAYHNPAQYLEGKLKSRRVS